MRLAPPFSDHAVLQRDQTIPVWGRSGPGEEVTVTLGGNTARVVSGPEGEWMVRLPPLPAGGPHEIVARSASGTGSVKDVLIGDVWICSGQSNMEWKLVQTPQATDAASSNLPKIRLLTVATPARIGRQTEIDGKWQVANAASLNAFSAVGGWFGRIVHAQLGVPVGLICNAWGGTRVQAWMSREALMRDPIGVDEVRAYEGHAYAPRQVDDAMTQEEWENDYQQRGSENRGLKEGWAGANFDDATWAAMPVPSRWQEHGHDGSGVFWFRRTVAIPPAWRGRDLDLHIGAVDKHDDTYVNGERVGGLTWADGPNTWNTPRDYKIPAKLVTGDTITIAVRARSHIYHGGLIGPEQVLSVHPVGDATGAVPLTGPWKYAVEQDWGVTQPPVGRMTPGNANAPFTLFDSRLAPLIPYGIRGAIWYQGESNAGEPAVYRHLLPQMIADWRRAFGQGDFPFYQVQLANFMAVSPNPRSSGWALLRDAQTATAVEDPHGGFAVAIDVGDALDIHPTDKRTVGERLARWALAVHYGLGGAPCGPLYTAMTVEANGRARVRFAHAKGLKTKDGKAPSHVSIAGVDRQFVWAETRIEGETLVAWSPKVSKPAAVRYAWADNPDGCNLVAGDGAPASPFRSDTW